TPICAPSSKPPGTGTAAIPRATMIDSSSAQQASAAKSLAGRTALVTGAGVGIGREIALALAGAGAVVGVHYHSSAPEARGTLEQTESRGGKGVLLPGDLTVEERAIGIVEEFVAGVGRLDLLVNNAGSPIRFTRIEECSTDLWRQVFDVN